MIQMPTSTHKMMTTPTVYEDCDGIADNGGSASDVDGDGYTVAQGD